MVVVTCDYPSSPHQTAPPSQSNVGEHAHISSKPSHPPEITPFDCCTSLVANTLGYHMYFLPQPPSSYSNHPPDDKVLCSSIPNSTLA